MDSDLEKSNGNLNGSALTTTEGSLKDSSSHENVDGAPSPRAIHGIKWGLVVGSVLSSIFLYALDNTIVANIVPPIVENLGEAEKFAWAAVGFMIGGLVVAMPTGKLYGIFNAKWLYMLFVVLFMAGSALCGAAPTMSALIVGRVIAGAGGNGMYVGVLTLLSVNTTDKERPTYLGLIGLIYGIGTVIGPIIGGAFAISGATWRWGFYINLVVGAVFIPILVFLLPSFDPRAGMGFGARIRLFDYLGATLQAGFFVCFCMAVNFGGSLYAWNSGQIIALFVVFGILLISFAFQQVYCWSTSIDGRMFPVHLLKKKEPVLLFITMAACNSGSMILMYYIPLYFQFTKGVGALDSGVKLLPLIVTATAAIMINGAMMSKTGFYYPWYVCGSVLIIIGGALISKIEIDTPERVVYGYQILLGFGLGAFLSAGYAVIQGIVDFTQMSNGVTLMLVGQLLGISLSLSISGATFVNITVKNLGELLPGVPRARLESAISGTADGYINSLDPETRSAALNILMNSIQNSFIMVYVAGAIALIASLFLSRKRLNLGPAAGA